MNAFAGGGEVRALPPAGPVSSHLVPLDHGWSLWQVAAVRSAGMPFGLLENLAMPGLLALPAGHDRDNRIRSACAGGIDAILRTDAITEAIAWQNPAAMATWLGRYAAGLKTGNPPKLSNRAYREAVVARYAQRYCGKNESIGFFGPVAWARFSALEPGLAQRGSGGCRTRTAYFEVWAIAALADAWAQDRRLLPYLPVRLNPAAAWDGETLRMPQRPPVALDAVSGAVLSEVKHGRRVGEILDAACSASGSPREQLLAGLLRMRDRRVVQIGFRVPISEWPERYLSQQIQQLPDEPLRGEFLERMEGLLRAREAASAARGTAAARATLDAISGEFLKAGCQAATAPRKQRYGRTPVYLDCRRDLDVTIGSDLLHRLGAPLAVLLDAARWLTTEVAHGVAEELHDRYRLLRRSRAVVTMSDLQFAAADVLATGGSVAPDVRDDFQQRWAEILPLNTTGAARLRSETVRPLISALFPASPLSWAAARYHSPDLMLYRTPCGAARWVLGEMHVAMNSLESRVFRTQSDDPDELVSATAKDTPQGRVVPLYPLDAAEVTSRAYPPPALDPPGLYQYWSFGFDQGHPEGVISAPAAAVLVEDRGDGQLIGRDPVGRWEAPVLEFFGEFLTALTVNLFKIRPPAPHAPRVILDDLVICRESWSAPVAEVPVQSRRSADYAYEGLRSWAAERGIPRHVFVRTMLEPKPIYVDFAAPLLLGNLARAIRRARSLAVGSRIEFAEMLPKPNDLWLTDDRGHRYTAEFRVVALDDIVRPSACAGYRESEATSITNR